MLHEQCSFTSATGSMRSPSHDEPAVAAGHAKCIQRILELRRKRLRLFSADLFAETAWDMLLELYLSDLTGRPILVHQLVFRIARACDHSLALAWQASGRGTRDSRG